VYLQSVKIRLQSLHTHVV